MFAFLLAILLIYLITRGTVRASKTRWSSCSPCRWPFQRNFELFLAANLGRR